jgi:hypothetical protein
MRGPHGLGRLAAAALLVLAACQAGAPQRADFSASDARQVVDPTELVAIVGGLGTASRLASVAAERGYRLERRDSLDGLGLVLMTFRLPPGTVPAEAIEALERREPAAKVGLNHAYRHAPAAGASARPRTYADALLGWPEAGCPAQVPVGLVDTAIDAGAPGLAGVSVVSRDVSARGAHGDVGHGTAVAELLAGPGRLGGARLYHAAVVGEVTGADPAAGVDDIVRAVDWLYSQGVRVVNISLAGPYNKILDRGLRAAADRGMVIVAAAGNDGAGAPPRYPAAFDYAIAVTAVDADLHVYRRAGAGDHIDFAAPGVDVFVPVDGGRYLSGTSISAPFVTAVIAADPSAPGIGSVGDARASLARAAVDLGPAGRDDTFGMGLATAAAGCRAPGSG